MATALAYAKSTAILMGGILLRDSCSRGTSNPSAPIMLPKLENFMQVFNISFSVTKSTLYRLCL